MATHHGISGLLITFQKNLKYPEAAGQLNALCRADLAKYQEIFVDPTNCNTIKDAGVLVTVLKDAIQDEIVKPCTDPLANDADTNAKDHCTDNHG